MDLQQQGGNSGNKFLSLSSSYMNVICGLDFIWIQLYSCREIKTHMPGDPLILMITPFELTVLLSVFFERSVADGVRCDFIRTEKLTAHVIME